MVVTRSKLREGGVYENYFTELEFEHLDNKRRKIIESEINDGDYDGDYEESEEGFETETDTSSEAIYTEECYGSESDSNTGMETEEYIYEEYKEMLTSIYTGEFFVKHQDTDTGNTDNMEIQISHDSLAKLKEIKQYCDALVPSIHDIVQNPRASMNEKVKALEHLYNYNVAEPACHSYNKSLTFFESFGKEKVDPLDALDTIETNKAIIASRIKILENFSDFDSEYVKHKSWVDTILKVPFGKYAFDIQSTTLHKFRKVLDEKVSFLEKPKDQIINMFAKMLKNPKTSVNSLGIYGVKGTGKTSIVKSISEAFNRPYRVLSLGGESDVSVLTGHHFTYTGAIHGRISDILIETQCMDPIILVDELDKISNTSRGKEIIGALIHLTDASTNYMYSNDRYFSGIQFDLSKVLFVFTYNDETKIDKILLDRIFKVKVDNYTLKQKLVIVKKHIIPKILADFCYTPQDIQFTDEVIQHIVNVSSNEEGMRNCQRRIELIVSRINTILLSLDAPIVYLEYSKLYSKYHSLPIILDKRDVDILLSEGFEDETCIFKHNGMYI